MKSAVSLPEKNRIARSFGLAAEKYDSYASLQRDIADKLFAELKISNPREILDLGSGTGYCARKFCAQFPDARVSSLDIAEAMLAFAKKNASIKDDTVLHAGWLCGDAERLPFKNDSFDLVMSNLTIQWCEKPGQVFKELLRVMKPGAHAWVSTLAEQTLVELKESWASVDDYVHVNNFLSREEILQHSGMLSFSTIDHIHSRETYFYNSLRALTDELKGIGAHNQNAGQATGLTGKLKLKKLKHNFEQNHIQGKGIPVTYDVVLLHLVK